MGGFDGEGVQSGSVLVVKSHSSIPLWSKVIGRSEHGPKVSQWVWNIQWNFMESVLLWQHNMNNTHNAYSNTVACFKNVR